MPEPDPALDWAAEHFGTPEEIKAQTLVSQRLVDTLSSPVFRPAQAPLSPLLAIRDVQAPTKAIQALRKPAFAFHRPMWMMMPPLFVHSMHLRTPSSPLFQDPTHVPVAAPSFVPFASRHTAQIPIIPHLPIFHFPIAAVPHSALPPSHTRPSSNTPVTTTMTTTTTMAPSTFTCDTSPPRSPPPCPYEAPLTKAPRLLRASCSLPNPSSPGVEFTNAKAHPSLRNTKPPKDSPVIAV
ncbi:hypothetical protein Pcinc_011327 [Petrolisthes cinctipes]|uniref:Uncharacterized protein n=1 Tax=Petrolisthes cinctipes TaxID=88211 RepID=A0AAE1KTJ5_PETCI|nr:hypothetical protein Pcinc_011327 [Petrolisthes cinctipes]